MTESLKWMGGRINFTQYFSLAMSCYTTQFHGVLNSFRVHPTVKGGWSTIISIQPIDVNLRYTYCQISLWLAVITIGIT